MLTVVRRDKFEDIYAQHKDAIDKTIDTADRIAFDDIVEQKKEPSVRYLMLLAANKQIQRYSRMDKQSLLKALNADTQRYSNPPGGNAPDTGTGEART